MNEEASVDAAPELNQTTQPENLDIDTTIKTNTSEPLPEGDTAPRQLSTPTPDTVDTKVTVKKEDT